MPRLRAVLECAVLAALFALVFAVDRARGGGTFVSVGLAVLFAGPVFRRLLVLEGRARPAARWTRALELVAFTGIVARPIGLWAHGFLAAVAVHLVATPPEGPAERESRATLLEELSVALIALGGVALALVANRQAAALPLVAALPLALEAWGPRAPRTLEAAARRAAAFGVAGAAAVMRGTDWRVGARADDLALSLEAVLVAVASTRVLDRTILERPTARLDAALQRIADWGARGFGAFGLVAAAAVLALALIAAGALRVTRTRTLEPASFRPLGGQAFEVDAPSTRPDEVRNESTLAVLEDGRALGPAHAPPETIRREGRGAYRHPGAVELSSSDGTDPRTNGRSYALRYDWSPGLGLVAVLLVPAVLLNVRRAARAAAAFERAPPAWIAAFVLAVAVGFRVSVALTEHDRTSGTLVKGMLFSDARDWFTVAVDFSRNDRSAPAWAWCSARRPFHYALLGAVFALAEPSLLVAQVFNVALSALTTVAVFDAVRRVAWRPAALLAALGHALLFYDAQIDLSVMTEPVGNFFAALAAWAFVLGSERLATPRPRRALLAFLGGGVCLGLSNLARPLTLAATLGLPLALALVVGGRGRWRQIAGGSLSFVAGVALTVGPWMLRQRLVHGIWTISENTAEAWYGATSPRYGGWSYEISQLLPGRSIAERVAYFMDGASLNLREHLVWYVTHASNHFGVTVRFMGPPGWVAISACAWYLATALGTPERAGARRGAAAGAALAVMLLALRPETPLYAISALGVVLALLGRRPVSLLVGLLLPTLASVAMLGMGYERRLTYSVEWVATAIGALCIFHGLERVEGVPPAAVALGGGGAWGRAGRAVGLVALAACILVGAGFARALTGTPPPRRPSSGLPAESWLPRALDAEERRALGPLAKRLVVRRVRLRRDFAIGFAAGERIAHWCPLFEGRPYAYMVFDTEPELAEGYAVYPGPLPPEAVDADLVLVGAPVVRANGGSSLEVLVLGVASMDGEPVRWFRPPGNVARAHADRIAAVSSASSPRR